jgi:hypothetical protein
MKGYCGNGRFLYISPMRTNLLLILVVLCHVSFGQPPLFDEFAVVADKDGYSNVRNAGGAGNKVVDTLNNGAFVFCMETKDGWTSIFYGKRKQELSGYIHHDRLKYISDYERIPGVSGSDSIFAKDSIRVVVGVQRLSKSGYGIFKTGKSYGTDGERPTTEYRSIFVRLGSRELLLPRTAIGDLFQPTIFHTKVNYDRKKDILYIQSMNSDGAGGYYVIWKIERGVYAGRFIASDF